MAVNLTGAAASNITPTACLGSTITQWTFDGSVTTPTTGYGAFSNGSGLTGPTFITSYSGKAVSLTGWTSSSSLDANDYVEFDVNMQGRSSTTLSFFYRSTSTGPTKLDFFYSTDGTTFNLFSSSNTLQTDSNLHTMSFGLSAVTALNDDPNAKFKIFAYSASGSSGTFT